MSRGVSWGDFWRDVIGDVFEGMFSGTLSGEHYGELCNRQVWCVNLALFSMGYGNGDCPDAVSKPYQASLCFAKSLGISMCKNKKLAC